MTCRSPILVLTTLALSIALAGMHVAAGSQARLSGRRKIPSARVQLLIDAGRKAERGSPPDPAAAEKLYAEALALSSRTQDAPGLAVSLRNLGNVAALRHETDRATSLYQQSLATARKSGDPAGQADALFNIARLLRSTDSASAVEALQQAANLYHEAGNTKLEVQSRIIIGNVLETGGQTDKARGAYAAAAALAHTLGDRKGEADALWYLGTLAYPRVGAAATASPDPVRAKDYYRKAIVLYHNVGDLVDEAWTWENLGGLFFLEGAADNAQKQYSRALAIYRKLHYAKQTASVLRQIANLDFVLSRYVEALQDDNEAFKIYAGLHDDAGRASELMHIGSLYNVIGQPDNASRSYAQALALLESTGNPKGLIEALQAAAYYSGQSGDHTAAIGYLRRLVPLLEKPGSGVDHLQNMSLLAAAYAQTSDYVKAKETLEHLLTEEQKAGLRALIPGTLGSLAYVERSLGHSDRALEDFRRELQLMESDQNSLARALVMQDIAEIEQEHGDLESADRDYDDAVQRLERLRRSLGGRSEFTSSFLSSRIDAYQEYTKLLIRMQKPAKAFALVQKMKARALLDILQAGKVQMTRSLTPQERQHEQDLRRISDDLNVLLVKEGVRNEIGSMKRAEAIKLRIADAEREFQLYEDEIYAMHPDLAARRAATTVELASLGPILPRDTVLLEFATLKDGSNDILLLFVVTRRDAGPDLKVHTVSLPRSELEGRVEALRAACSDPRRPFRAPSAALYKLLIEPAEPELAGKKRLLICPDGVLWDVPFAALLTADGARPETTGTGDRFLLDRFEIDYAYSATGVKATLRLKVDRPAHDTRKSMLVFADPNFGGEERFGDNPELHGQRPIGAASRPIGAASRPVGEASRPIGAASRPIGAASRPIGAASRDVYLPRGGQLADLPGTRLEAQAIKADFRDATIFTGALAQEATAKLEAGKYRYLHFATHGFFNDGAPLLSAVVLSVPTGKSRDDGFLTAREMFDLDLHADMVVLSACNTARGEKRSGEGIVGLTWALFAAGAPTQVVSQWSVNDASTAQLMKSFYANLVKVHLQKGEALRQACLSIRREFMFGSGGAGSKRSNVVRNQKWAHPYFWAPFVLLGNWR